MALTTICGRVTMSIICFSLRFHQHSEYLCLRNNNAFSSFNVYVYGKRWLRICGKQLDIQLL
jgi:hypothetical protein